MVRERPPRMGGCLAGLEAGLTIVPVPLPAAREPPGEPTPAPGFVERKGEEETTKPPVAEGQGQFSLPR